MSFSPLSFPLLLSLPLPLPLPLLPNPKVEEDDA
jgi:hypothetical protein